MAIKVTKPLKHFVDISLAFSPHPLTGDITVLRDYRAINAALKNCIMIAVEEKPFNTTFGSRVLQLLFEVMDGSTSILLEEEIERSIRYNEPRVQLQEVNVVPYPELNEFKIEIKYLIVGYEEVITFTHILTPTR
jgi:phage baseplate assembly protein W